MKTAQPNAQQKRWREDVRALGCIVTRAPNPEIHHPAGRTAKHLGEHIGHWYVLPLSTEEHRAIHSATDRKEREHRLFVDVLRYWRERHPFEALPFSADVLVGCLTWR